MEHLTTAVIVVLYVVTVSECNGFQAAVATTTTPLAPAAISGGPSPPYSPVVSQLPTPSNQSLLSSPALNSHVHQPISVVPANNGPPGTAPSQNLSGQTSPQRFVGINQVNQQSSQGNLQQNMQLQYQMNLMRSQMYPRESILGGSNPLSHLWGPALSPPSTSLLSFPSSVQTVPSQTSFAPSPMTIFLQMVTFISRVQAAKDLKCKTIPELLGMDVPVYFTMSCDNGKCPLGRVCRKVGSVGFCCPKTVTDSMIAFRGLMGTAEAMQTSLSSL